MWLLPVRLEAATTLGADANFWHLPPRVSATRGSSSSEEFRTEPRAPTPATTAAQYRCSERGQRVSRLTTRPEQHLVDDSDAYGHRVEIAPPIGAAARPLDRTRARARACHQAAVRRAGESAAALCRVGQSRTAHHGALIVRVGRAEAAAPRARAGSRARGRHHRQAAASDHEPRFRSAQTSALPLVSF